MGKANRAKLELYDAVDMVSLIQTLKDIADNKFYTLTSSKDKFRRFGETFVEFFRMVKMSTAQHPLISNENPKVAILVVTVEGSFLGEFNNRIIRTGLEQLKKHNNATFIAVGTKKLSALEAHTPDLKKFPNMEDVGIYQSAVDVKDYLVQNIMEGKFGKVIVCYSWPKSFDTLKARVVKLLPCDDLLSKQAQFVDVYDTVIEESDPSEVVGYLSNLWITTRLYEIFMDTVIASAAAQAKFLDDSLEKMKKEEKKLRVKFRKAKKMDIDTSLRETFSARMMTTK